MAVEGSRMIPEALYTDWVSRNIADYFAATGFRVRYAAVSQPAEATYPFDRLYALQGSAGPISIFALQFKAPLKGAKGLLRFRIDLEQLRKLQAPVFRHWVVYALPFFVDVRLQQTSLHLVNFTRPLQIPARHSGSSLALHWRAPYLMIERSDGADAPTDQELEIYKAVDEFYDDGEGWFLSRRACVLSSGIMRYEIPHRSWGELFQAICALKIGRHLLEPGDIGGFVSELRDVPVQAQNSVLVAVDLVRQTVELLSLLPHEAENQASANEGGFFSF